MRFVCKDFKRDLANVNFRTESNSKVLNDGFSRLIEFHALFARSFIYAACVYAAISRELYFRKKKKLEREDAWMDEWMDNFLLDKSIERIIFKDSNVRVWDNIAEKIWNKNKEGKFILPSSRRVDRKTSKARGQPSTFDSCRKWTWLPPEASRSQWLIYR